ncbi:MAG TPA: heavy-metal-associated domain-containing protein [Bacteroidales bacterium]|nr:heavy-metal-associated domain-containing protein [Bacteroidales bacterium]
MKTMKSIMMVFAAVLFSANMFAQAGKTKTDTFKVLGNCSMCKERIEKAVKAEGATAASWDSKTKMLTVSYDPSRTNTDALARKVASVGHDTGKYKADDKTYNSLPGCCKYDRSGNAKSDSEGKHDHHM